MNSFFKVKPVNAFLFLCGLYIIYSSILYLNPLFHHAGVEYNHNELSEGKLVWQKYNCQSCHQLYGLGGHIGPDITNVYSSPGKTENYIKGIIIGGNGKMPAFQMSSEDLSLLVSFLKNVDRTGQADPKSFSINWYGSIFKKDDGKRR